MKWIKYNCEGIEKGILIEYNSIGKDFDDGIGKVSKNQYDLFNAMGIIRISDINGKDLGNIWNFKYRVITEKEMIAFL